jgi:hypothetical protein
MLTVLTERRVRSEEGRRQFGVFVVEAHRFSFLFALRFPALLLVAVWRVFASGGGGSQTIDRVCFSGTTLLPGELERSLF